MLELFHQLMSKAAACTLFKSILIASVDWGLYFHVYPFIFMADRREGYHCCFTSKKVSIERNGTELKAGICMGEECRPLKDPLLNAVFD